MSGKKNDTTQSFRKRVDHLEAGSHRPPQAMEEPAVCEICGIIYAERRWVKPEFVEEGKKHAHFRPASKVICPACEAIRDDIPSGYLYMEGDFLKSHLEEIENLVRNEADRAAEDNPLARIMKWEKDENGRLTVTTTTEHLAQRFGNALEKAYDGKVRYDFSHENKLARVYWRRD